MAREKLSAGIEEVSYPEKVDTFRNTKLSTLWI